MPTSCGLDELVDRLERGGAHRVLRRLDVREGRTGVEVGDGALSVGVALDTETTGTDARLDDIVELGLRRFRYDGAGRIVEIGRPWSWLEDPGRPLDDEVSRITGLTDADLVGERIDDATALGILKSADVVVAHHAAFDRPFVERRLEKAAGLAWACSCREINWAGRGYDGRALGSLLLQSGWFHDGHRAGADVDAVIQLLRLELPEGHTTLHELVETASRPTFRVEAVGAAFGAKDRLRRRGYRWNVDVKVWWREVAERDLDAERTWLAGEVYGVDPGCRAFQPRLTPVTWRERHA